MELNWNKLQLLINDVMTTNQILNYINANKHISITRDNYQVLPDVINLMRSSHRIKPIDIVNSQLGTSVLSESFTIDMFIDQLIENFDLIFETPATDSDIQYVIQFVQYVDLMNDLKPNWVSDSCKDVNWEK